MHIKREAMKSSTDYTAISCKDVITCQADGLTFQMLMLKLINTDV